MAKDVFDVMATQRSVRAFTDEPVSEEDLRHILQMATMAPNGGNAQTWRFIVVRDAEKRRRLGQLALEALLEQVGARSAEEALARPGVSHTLRDSMLMTQALGQRPPVLVLACTRRHGSHDPGASIFPGAQNLMLAAWAMGLGTVLTTVFKLREPQVRALLGIPEDVYIGALIPVGHPARAYGPPKRKPLEDVLGYDGWR